MKHTTHRLFALFLTLCLIAGCFVACGGKQQNQANFDRTHKPDSQLQDNSLSDATDATEGEAPFPTEADAESIDEDDRLWGTYNADSAGYFDGTRSGGGFSYKEVIFNSNGQVVYEAAEGESIVLYGNGYFISQIGDVWYLKEATGKTVFSSESLVVTGFGLVDSRTDCTDFLSDGYVFIYNIRETYNDTTYEVGIMGTDGNWISQLSETHPIINSDVASSAKDFQDNTRYAGDGVLLLRSNYLKDYDYRYVLYNMKDNAIYRFEYDGSRLDVSSDIEYASFYNGRSAKMSKSTLYEIADNGVISATDYFPGDAKSQGNYGLYRNPDGDYILLAADQDCVALRNANGIIKAFSDTNIVNGTYAGNGTWLLMIQNDADTYFYTHIDTAGQFLYDPVKLGSGVTYLYTDNGYELPVGDQYTGVDNGTKYIIDSNGNIIYESKEINTKLSLNNGVVCEETSISGDKNYYLLNP